MTTVSYFAFNEISSDVFAFDTLKNSNDMGDDPGSVPVLSVPDVLQSNDGRGRIFGDDVGLVGNEAAAGALRLTRDCTVMARIAYQTDVVADGAIGTLVARGTTGTAAERMLFGVEFVRVNAGTLRVRARWEEIGGAAAVVAGVEFVITPGEVFSLAVSRTWIDSTTVEVLYAVNGELVGSETVAAGDIGEGDGGTLTIGCAGNGTGNYERFLPEGTLIESLSIENDAMCIEELRQEHRRVAVHEPNGYRILRAYLPPGEAWSRDPASNIQKWIAAEGHTLGHVTARAAALLEDYLPDRAYGRTLAHWEKILKLPVIPGATIQQRRNAVIAKRRSVLGATPADMRTALAPLYGQDAADIQIFEFTGLREDDFSFDDISPDEPSNLWRTFNGVTVSANSCVCRIDGSVQDEQWATGKPAYREASIGAQLVGEAVGTTIVIDYDAVSADVDGDVLIGLMMRAPGGGAFFFGAMNRGGEGYRHTHYSVAGGTTSAFTSAGGVEDSGRIYLKYEGGGLYTMGEVVAGVPIEFASGIAGPSDVRWCGFGCFSTYKNSNPQDGVFANAQIFEPKSTRAFSFFAYRDPALAGSYNLQRAQEQIEKQSHAHTHGVAMDNAKGISLSSTGRLGVDPLMPRTSIETVPPVVDNLVLPAQAANLAAIMGELPDHIWAEFGALPILDSVGSTNFSVSAGTPSYGVSTSGLWDGTDHTSRVAFEISTTNDLLSLEVGEDLSPGTESFAMLIVYKIPTAAVGNKNVVSTRQSGDLKGWSTAILNSSNRVYAQGDQGASHVSAIVTGNSVGPLWRYALVVCNRATSMLYVYTDLSSASVSIAGHGSYSGAGELTIGWAPNGTTLADMQVAYAAYWAGAKAENLGAAAGAAFWQPQLDNPAP